MPGKDPYRVRRVCKFEELQPLIDGLYNKPIYFTVDEKGAFLDEYQQADELVRSKLGCMGEIDAFGRADFSMGDPWNSNRKIGVTVNVEELFNEEVVTVLRTAVEEIPNNYLVVLSGDCKGGTFYICISREEGILGYAPDRKVLELFGFHEGAPN